MNCHQILSGACNAGDHCYAVGSVEGVPFTAYAAGCNIVILATSFERVQIIPGAWHNYIRISCLDCSTDTGKIAAAYENQLCIFEPTPLIHNSSSHHLDYRWVQTGSLVTDSHISSLSWNLEGTRLLTGGEILQLWRQHPAQETEYDPENVAGVGGVTFEIGEDTAATAEEEEEPGWVCIWRCHTATPVVYMAFSPDGTLFATSGRSDRLVKIWFENKQLLFPSKSLDHSMSFGGGQSTLNEVNYGFVYIAHPRAVTHLSWRKTSKYMPKGAVSNMLVTSCRDNICRLWVETVLPEDGLVNMSQFDPRATQNPKFRTHRHKHRFLQRLRHMKTCFHIRRHAKSQPPPGSGFSGLAAPIPTLPSTYSVHDFHSYGYHGTGLTPGLHFHLAASINAETDIPLVPSLVTADPDMEPNFVLHWLNNKEMHFSLQAEAMLHEMTRKQMEKEEASAASGTDGSAREVHEGSQNDTDQEEHSARKRVGRVAKAASQDESSEEQHGSGHSSGHSHQSLSATTSINSLATDAGAGAGVGAAAGLVDPLDAAIECLLRDWHHSPDLLFAIHPIDGSFLVWVAEWLDEYHPGLFRQAQVSFASRLPSTFPLGDAMTMSTCICLYNAYNCHGDRDAAGVMSLSLARGMSPPAPSSPNGVGLEDVPSSTALLPSVQEEVEGFEGAQLTAPALATGASPAAEAVPVGENAANKSAPISADPSPTVSMVTKHSNGTLNLWQLTFADKSKFSQVLTISHGCRASGHRFRVNDITCHPVLPLLLTTSHHNISDVPSGCPSSQSPLSPMGRSKDVTVPTGFCSELILWRVDAVGPLSRSGGVSELARINSPEISAFSNVAWIPTLLPSTTLGNLSNSPSACFVASDGHSLRVYQAVIDARTLLAEVNSSERRSRMLDSLVSLSTDTSSEDGLKHTSLHDHIRIVSQQSTARPGCVIQLDAITDATHDWKDTQFLHVFQEQLITGERVEERSALGVGTALGLGSGMVAGAGVGGGGANAGGAGDAGNAVGAGALGLMHSELGAMVDLHQSAVFEEPFYIVVLEKAGSESVLHMWRLVIASQPDSSELSGSMMYVPDSQLVQDEEEPELGGRSGSMAGHAADPEGSAAHHSQASHVLISTTKVCTQLLPLPDGVEVVHAAPAAGHLSSASIYPACFAPYIIVTACSDSTIRFWKCKVSGGEPPRRSYEWCEWEMSRRGHTSTIDITGQPLNISAAYSGRIACAYKYGKSFTRPSKNDPDSRFVNLCVAIYECESTGGSEWVLEDTIHLKNIHLPRMQLHPQLDLSVLHERPRRFGEERGSRRNGDDMHSSLHKSGTSLTAVPSFSTLQSLRRSIIECGNTCPLTQKHLVQLDWVSKEDGSHILTVAVGSKVLLFTPVSSDLAQANMKAMKESQSANRPILRKASSLAVPQFVDEIRWMKLRKIDLVTADGLPPLPMQLSWVRDGILVVGMDSEMHVYSQWKPNVKHEQVRGALAPQESEELPDSRNLRDEDLRNLVQETTQRRMATVSSMPHLSRVSSINLTMLDSKKKRGAIVQAEAPSVDYMPDYGLFEASRIACPVLPQYHPKQLMELLNSGKIRWVKAILAHLVRCISGTCAVRQGTLVQGGTDEENLVRQRGWSRSRTLSVSYVGAGTNSPLEQRGSTTAIPEEVTLDYAEISSVPPLPLWTLLAADREQSGVVAKGSEESKDYNDLFDGNVADADESLDDLLIDEPDSPRRHDRRVSLSQERQSLSHFGPRQGRVLSRLLTHTHLPGLSSLDQMHLLALADTVSTCNSDFAERFAIDAAKSAIAKENLTGVPEGEDISTDSLDDCGLRYLLAMKHYSYLLRCLPLAQRAHFQRQGVGTNNLVWAFHSESEEELLALIPSYAKGSPKWAQLKELGVGWWLRSHTLLKTCIEKLAKATFMVNQDPLDAAIFYLAMKKKSLVWGLFRSKRDERMTSFFSNNFNEDRWRKAALKNAFALLGKQRFEHAAAFFLLAGALRDAIEVCLNKLEDFQLAMIIARLYEGERDPTPPSLQRLLWEEILGCDADGGNMQMDRAHPDPFLRSMALWILKDYSGSLNSLLHTNVGSAHPQYNDEDKPESGSANPNVFNFYVYLRTHPLLVRQYIATSAQGRRTGPSLVLAGFSYGSDAHASDKQLMLEDSITPLERQLYFTTAHAHFKAGCPALALEVLSKLPCKVLESTGSDSPRTINSPSKMRQQNPEIDSGIIQWDATDKNASESSALDWSAPVARKDDELVLDWGNDEDPEEDTEDSSDQGLSMKPVPSDSEAGGSSGQLDIMAQQLKFVACLKILMEELSTLATGFEVDGGQLRYQLYVWLEREVDALRHLCNYSSGELDIGAASSMDDVLESEHCGTPIPRLNEKPTLHEILMAEKMDFEAKVQRASRRKRWLKANEALLRTLLSYCSLHGASGGGLAAVRMELVLLLQELQQEKSQQQLLSPLPFPTTLPLLSASVACHKTVVADPVRHLQSELLELGEAEPSSFPMTFSIFLDEAPRIQSQTHDMLATIMELRSPPSPSRMLYHSEVFVLRDLAVALSACIYQSLCDSDTFSVKQQPPENYPPTALESLARLNTLHSSSHLIAGQAPRRRRYSSDEPLQVTTHPSKWPGVTNLRALLAREKDEDTPRLNILLVEAFVATYMSLLVYSLSTCDSLILYRLAGQRFVQQTWASLFGGGVKKLLRVAASNPTPQTPQTPQSAGPGPLEREGSGSEGSGVWTAVTNITKQRYRLNMRLLGQFGSQTGAPNMKEDKPTYREQFVPPEMSMISYFLIKPQMSAEAAVVDYDSAESAESETEDEEDEEDVFEGSGGGMGTSNLGTTREPSTEHSNPNSFSWCVLRLAVVRVVQKQLHDFLNAAGIELPELPVLSPLVHGVLRTVAQWQDLLAQELDERRPPPADYIPACYVEPASSGPAIHKYRSLLEASNTPFHGRHASAAPARRLWRYLVRQELVQEIFIRAVFGKRRSTVSISEPSCVSDGTRGNTDDGAEHCSVQPSVPEPVKIIHKDQDSISAFCLNQQAASGLMTLATPREIQEMDISLLLESPSWLEDECEFDVVNLTRDPDTLPASSFLVIQTTVDRPLAQQSQAGVTGGSGGSTGSGGSSGLGAPASPQPGLGGQTGRGASVVQKHRVDGIRRVCSHPFVSMYLTGAQDGSVQMWEWNATQPVAVPRPPGTFAKVTRVRFSEHGNKFGVADGDGNVSLWQASFSSSSSAPFFTYQCHNKLTSDFVFLGSCSLIASAGHSSESRNLAIWDSLLPQKKALVQIFTCHEQGASALVYAPQHQLLISAGKRGDVCIVDVRQRVLRHRFQAHDSAVKCLALDPAEEFFVTGSADGDIKVWALAVHAALYSFPGEHARSSFFKNIGQGVTQIHIDGAHRMFSCGADGSMKVRQLPDRESTVHTLF